MKSLNEVLEVIPLHELSLINGKLLGDGNLTNDGLRKPRFRFQHRLADQGWCNYCYECLRDHIPINAPKYAKNPDKRIKAGYSETVYVQSKTSPLFTFLKGQWYNGRKKVLPLDLLRFTLSEESLAWWYQDDGHLNIHDGIIKKIILSTDNFTKEENVNLIDLLKELFTLTFSLDGKNRLCLYDQPQIMYFLHLVHDYVHPSMARKLPPQELPQSYITIPNKRTTIHLPYHLNKPSQQIRNLFRQINSEDFINDWFRNEYKKFDKPLTEKYSHQVVLTATELVPISTIQYQTGLRMNDIVFILLTRKDRIDGYPID